ncbi:MAG: nucleotidyl transferase AbiEii/AbiGii toxin family protein [Candidatus Micrarchaeales archaeon]
MVRIIYEIDNTVEIHGGTAIWRCFGGRRFSKDIDVYLESQEKLEELKARIGITAEKYGAKLSKFKDTGNLIFAELLLDDIHSEIDINYKSYYKNPVIKNYETLDGTIYEVLIPPPEALLAEKIEAYNDRKSITDLYDIRILADFVRVDEVSKQLKTFLLNIKNPGKEEEDRLKNLIYEGPLPTFKTLVEYIKSKIS